RIGMAGFQSREHLTRGYQDVVVLDAVSEVLESQGRPRSIRARVHVERSRVFLRAVEGSVPRRPRVAPYGLAVGHPTIEAPDEEAIGAHLERLPGNQPAADQRLIDGPVGLVPPNLVASGTSPSREFRVVPRHQGAVDDVLQTGQR